MKLLPSVSVLVLALGCASSPGPAPDPPAPANPATLAAPTIEANWKERLDQPYVFLEHRGDYRQLGVVMRRVLESARCDGIEVEGPPFALFYDDPGRVAISDLRSRACLPVANHQGLATKLGTDLLPRAMVAYGLVPGAYDQVPRAYPALFRYLDDHGWVQGGPVREVYLVNPGDVASFSELVCEVQVPWTTH